MLVWDHIQEPADEQRDFHKGDFTANEGISVLAISDFGGM